MKRSQARELMMQMLFEMDIHGDFTVEKKQKFLTDHEISDSKMEFYDELFEAVINNKDEIDNRINKFSRNWNIQTMSKVDLAIMRVAVAELYYSKTAPESVAISEAVELAKRFGGENSGRFINGILGSMVKVKDE